MSGHSKWSQIKHKKEATDHKRGLLFSKLLQAIRAAAREEPNPDFNPRLRSAIQKAKEENMPMQNIERAIKSAQSGELEDLLIEAYGPEGSGIIITALTDSKNRTMNEIKALFKDYDVKLAPQGGLLWSFIKTEDGYKPNFSVNLSAAAGEKINRLIEALEEREDIEGVFTNAGSQNSNLKSLNDN